MIPVKLINIYTNKILVAKSITEFCRKANLNKKNSKIHIYPVLKGLRFHRLGWCLPKNYKIKLSLKDIYGNYYNGTLKELSEKYNISYRGLWKLATKKKKIVNGLFLSNEKPKFAPLNPIKINSLALKTPNNKLVISKNIIGLTRQVGEKNLSYRRLLDLVHGKTYNVKGYKIENLNLELKKILNVR